jgi:predicted Zn-dependent protease
VVGHEIAHCLCNHLLKRVQARELGIHAQKYKELCWQQEFEADELGMMLASKAGYNPRAGIVFFKLGLTSKERVLPLGENHHPPVRLLLSVLLMNI